MGCPKMPVLGALLLLLALPNAPKAPVLCWGWVWPKMPPAAGCCCCVLFPKALPPPNVLPLPKPPVVPAAKSISLCVKNHKEDGITATKCTKCSSGFGLVIVLTKRPTATKRVSPSRRRRLLRLAESTEYSGGLLLLVILPKHATATKRTSTSCPWCLTECAKGSCASRLCLVIVRTKRTRTSEDRVRSGRLRWLAECTCGGRLGSTTE